MAKTADANANVEVESASKGLSAQGIAITPEVLALISAAVAAAVKEAKRDPKEEARLAKEEADRMLVIREEEARVRAREAFQSQCPHLDAYENYAFCGQFNCMGELTFLCSQCLKPFYPTDPEYRNYVRYVKLDRIGKARQ